MKASVLSIGSELLQGFLIDTNVTFLAQELGGLGIDVVSVFQVGDDLDSIVRALERATTDADLVVTTGGIGPTADDLTREAVAVVCREEPTIDPKVLETVRDFFTRRGASMPERNAKQAWIIPSAEILPNPNGTAPGWLVRHDGKIIVSMPGVPREMMPMWQQQAQPRLEHDLPQRTIVTQTLKTIGLGESAVEERLRWLVDREVPVVSTYAKNDGVHIRIHAASNDAVFAHESVAEAEREIRDTLGHHVYGYLDDPLPQAVLHNAVDRGETIAIWESGTGAQVASLFLSDDAVAHVITNARTTALDNYVSAQAGRSVLNAAHEYAVTIRDEASTSYGMGVVAEFSPADDTGRHDARIAIAVASADGVQEVEHRVAAAPAEIRRRSTLLAAEFLRLVLMDTRASHPSEFAASPPAAL